MHCKNDGGDEKKLDNNAVDGACDGLRHHHFQIKFVGFIEDTEKVLSHAPGKSSEKLGREKGNVDAERLFGKIAVKEPCGGAVGEKLKCHTNRLGIDRRDTEDKVTQKRGYKTDHATPQRTCDKAAQEHGKVHRCKLGADLGDISRKKGEYHTKRHTYCGIDDTADLNCFSTSHCLPRNYIFTYHSKKGAFCQCKGERKKISGIK